MADILSQRDVPKSLIRDFFEDKGRRERILQQIKEGPERDSRGSRIPLMSRRLARKAAIAWADKVYSTAARDTAERLRFRAAKMAKDAGNAELAAALAALPLPGDTPVQAENEFDRLISAARQDRAEKEPVL